MARREADTFRRLWLQWGRVVKDAEITASARYRSDSVPLQWGRVVKDAEIAEYTHRPFTGKKLQWGRVVKDAEMAPVPNVCCADSYDSRIERSI